MPTYTERGKLRSVQLIHVRHVLTGEPACSDCGRMAHWFVGSGVDPTPVPYCHSHAATLLESAAWLIRSLTK